MKKLFLLGAFGVLSAVCFAEDLPPYATKLAEQKRANEQLPYKGPFIYECEGGRTEPMTVVFYQAEPPRALLGRSGKAVLGFLKNSQDGDRYEAPGVVFIEKNGEATVTWMGVNTACRLKS